MYSEREMPGMQQGSTGQAKNQLSPINSDCAAIEILQYAEMLTNRAHSLASWMDDKLSSVYLPSTTASAIDEPVKKAYPPLFNELRFKFESIENALNHMESIMSRVQL